MTATSADGRFRFRLRAVSCAAEDAAVGFGIWPLQLRSHEKFAESGASREKGGQAAFRWIGLSGAGLAVFSCGSGGHEVTCVPGPPCAGGPCQRTRGLEELKGAAAFSEGLRRPGDKNFSVG
jgi:hypothetical protein